MHDLPRTFSLDAVQAALREARLEGWLFYDFRGTDPIARNILCLPAGKLGTRRWFYFVPAQGEPRKLNHAIEPAMLDGLPGAKTIYLSWQSLRDGVKGLLGGARRIAMQYSALNDVPYVSRVDAGTIELVRSYGVEVVSSADLAQLFDATLSPAQIESHRRAARILRALIDETFGKVKADVIAGRAITERTLLEFVEGRLGEQGLIYDHPAIIGVNAHAADPHFEVPAEGAAPIRRGDLLLFDVWAKEKAPGSIYADITWTTFVGDRVPEDILKVFTIVRDARDAGIARARAAFRSGERVGGCDVDRATRQVIEAAGHGDRFIHRTGHSIHETTHGNGANIDDLETHDTRALLPRTLFSVEPGIYLPGRFGIRSEVDVYHTGSDAEVTGPPHQAELKALLA